MGKVDVPFDLGMLCRCCDHTYKIPELEGLTASQREVVEELCKLCVDSFELSVCQQEPLYQEQGGGVVRRRFC